MADLWFAERGTGDPFVLIHPGGTDSRSLGSLLDELADTYRLITPELRGHGRTADTAGEWTFSDLAADVAALLRELGLTHVHLFGWSDGAIVALELALAHPDLVRSLVFGAAPVRIDGWHPGVLGGEPPTFMADAYGELSPDGIEHWPVVTAKSARLHTLEPMIDNSRLEEIELPVLVVVADDDEVQLGHAIEVFESLPHGELAVLPRATHGAIIEKPRLLADLIRTFHDPDAGDGIAPLRRGK